MILLINYILEELITMSTKRSWQIPALVASYLIGILYIINFMYYQITNKESFLSVIILGAISMIFIILIIALIIRRPWAYYMSIGLLIIICILSAINIIFIFFMPFIWIILIPISGIVTLYSILCSYTRIYFGVGKEKNK